MSKGKKKGSGKKKLIPSDKSSLDSLSSDLAKRGLDILPELEESMKTASQMAEAFLLSKLPEYSPPTKDSPGGLESHVFSHIVGGLGCLPQLAPEAEVHFFNELQNNQAMTNFSRSSTIATLLIAGSKTNFKSLGSEISSLSTSTRLKVARHFVKIGYLDPVKELVTDIASNEKQPIYARLQACEVLFQVDSEKETAEQIVSGIYEEAYPHRFSSKDHLQKTAAAKLGKIDKLEAARGKLDEIFPKTGPEEGTIEQIISSIRKETGSRLDDYKTGDELLRTAVTLGKMGKVEAAMEKFVEIFSLRNNKKVSQFYTLKEFTRFLENEPQVLTTHAINSLTVELLKFVDARLFSSDIYSHEKAEVYKYLKKHFPEELENEVSEMIRENIEDQILIDFEDKQRTGLDISSYLDHSWYGLETIFMPELGTGRLSEDQIEDIAINSPNLSERTAAVACLVATGSDKVQIKRALKGFVADDQNMPGDRLRAMKELWDRGKKSQVQKYLKKMDDQFPTEHINCFYAKVPLLALSLAGKNEEDGKRLTLELISALEIHQENHEPGRRLSVPEKIVEIWKKSGNILKLLEIFREVDNVADTIYMEYAGAVDNDDFSSEELERVLIDPQISDTLNILICKELLCKANSQNDL